VFRGGEKSKFMSLSLEEGEKEGRDGGVVALSPPFKTRGKTERGGKGHSSDHGRGKKEKKKKETGSDHFFFM